MGYADRIQINLQIFGIVRKYEFAGLILIVFINCADRNIIEIKLIKIMHYNNNSTRRKCK